MSPAPNKPSVPCLNIAHRGAGSLAPENTLIAARKALAAGAAMWETDVAVTADGELILLHDDTLERTSNAPTVFPERAPWPVHLFTLAEIRRLDFGSWFITADPFGQIAAGAVPAAEQAQFVGLTAPTLAEALAFTRQHHWQINVEIKDAAGLPAHNTVAEKVAALIESFHMERAVLVSSFNHRYLARIKAANAQLSTAALVEEAPANPVDLLRSLQAQAYHPPAEALTPALIATLRRQGFGVNVWTINETASMQQLLEAGVSGLFTDFPQRLTVLIQQ